MTFRVTMTGQIKKYETREEAERAVEIFFPTDNGYRYEVCPSRPVLWTVRAWGTDNQFKGYCHYEEDKK